MKKITQWISALVLTIAISFNGFSQTNISDQLQPVELSNVKLAGILGQRFANNLETRAKNRSDMEIYLSYYEQPVDSTRWFSGEHIGKWLITACNSWKYSKDPELKQLIDECVNRLLKCQLPNGYLGSQRAGFRFYEVDWNQTCNGKKQDWNFDTWNHNLTMMGLLTHYETFNDQRSLQAVKKIAQLYMNTFAGESNRPNSTVYQNEDGKVDLAATNSYGMLGSGATCAIYPFAWLYRLNGDIQYLNFCRYIESLYFTLIGPRFVLTNDPNNRQSYLRKPCEDFLNFMGYIDLYKTSGSDTMLITSQNMFNQFAETNQITKNLGLSLDYLCDLCPFAIFSLKMLELTGDPQYANILEPVIYNSLNAHDDGHSCGVANNASFNGNNTYRSFKKDGSGFCCYSMTAMAISYYPELFYMKSEGGKGLAVNFYESSTLTTNIAGTNINLKQETLYPLDGKVNLSVDPEKSLRFSLALRIPQFCDGATVRVNGKPIDQKIVIGQYVRILREWKKGDKVEMEINTPAKLVNYGMLTLVPKNLMRAKLTKDPDSRAIQKGPLALVVDKTFNTNAEDFTLKLNKGMLDLTLVKNEESLSGYVFKAATTNAEKPVLLMPFADAGKKDYKYMIWFDTDK